MIIFLNSNKLKITADSLLIKTLKTQFLVLSYLVIQNN